MNNQPLVSIIITAYNYGQFVAQAVQSALDQSYSNVEVIVVDDGSTDNTDEILIAFGSQITHIKQPNSGVVRARNNGASHASGEYLLFLDADDYLPTDFVAVCVSKFTDFPEVDIVYTDRMVISKKKFRYQSRQWNKNFLLLSNYIGMSTLMKRSSFEQVGGYREKLNNKKSYEDWDLWLTLSEKGYIGLYCPQTFYYHRKLQSGSRNDANTWQKAYLRWPLIKLHWRSYVHLLIKPDFYLLVWNVFLAKRQYLMTQQA